MSGLWAWMWPCHGVNIYKDGLMMERMWPVGHDRTVLDYLYFFPEGVSEADKERPMASSGLITAEDIKIVEAVQRNLDAGIYATGRLSPRHRAGGGLVPVGHGARRRRGMTASTMIAAEVVQRPRKGDKLAP